MRYNEFKHQIQEQDDLLEIRMDPTSLAAAVKNIDARVGIEFEMIVPNVAGGDDDSEMIMDMDEDRGARSISDIVDFFFDQDYNSRNDVRRLEIQLRSDFQDWASEDFDSRWETDKETFVYDYVKDHMDVEDVAELLELDPDSLDGLTRTLAERAADLIIAEGGDRLDNIREQALEEFFSDTEELEGEWLGEAGLVDMSDVHNEYSGTIAWPYWTTEESDSGASIDAIADDFSQAIGRPVNASERYHGARREPGKYVVEPDGSLNPDDSDDKGLEFVSPPLTFPEMLEDLEKVRRWAGRIGAYTNKSTGLHMNVSIPGYDDKNLDFVKLALLVGDQYVLDQFGRSANTYATSALSKIQARAKNLSPDQVQGLFNQMRAGLNKFASRSIQGSDVGKYTSIHPQGKYIEFRSPGGDWLSEDPKTLVSTLMRFIVALDAAMDPDKYRKEYLSKLRKLLAPESEEDPLNYFVKYSSGELPKQALKSFIRNAQFQRKAKKGTTEKMWWRVGLKSNPNYSIEVVGRTRDEAVEAAMRANGELMSYNFENDFTAVPLRPFTDKTGQQKYEVIRLADGRVTATFDADNDEEALEQFDRMFPGPDRQRYDVRRAGTAEPQTPTLTAPETQPDANFAFVDRTNNQVVQWLTRNTREEAERQLQGTGLAHLYNVVEVRPRTSTDNRPMQPSGVSDSEATHEIVDRRTLNRMFVFSAQSETEAADKFEDWLQANGYPVDTEDYGWRRISRPIPGSTLDLQRQRAAAAQPEANSNLWWDQTTSGFTGNWRIMIDGEEVHRFGGVGNVQADANRFATRWLLAQQRAGSLTISDSAEIELLPVMSNQT
jgi:hypothetical protein